MNPLIQRLWYAAHEFQDAIDAINGALTDHPESASPFVKASLKKIVASAKMLKLKAHKIIDRLE